ncbi:efflux RND transporter periplasmic adaptor subunit [Catenovulum adriaticum]|uniref:Efflux RND transporter periplasmic adaptor subunit n=1 Tax=Catenovulum adriaticum TaxID=2984846 RepID=A0ABY7API7_9ALTE|nr:efflux RND transporter periplasmic adaptor subunit [Catenovulum sp. TS8]WAJ71482.1 efflux RND transporter periplasmic adaptor subunit [Catenovulum sp. TS8]
MVFNKQKLINIKGAIIKWLVTPIVLLGLAYSGYQWLENNKPEPEKRLNKVKRVKVFTIKTTNQSSQLLGYSQGLVSPSSRFDLKNEVEGKISYVSPNMVTGGVIEEGELLLEIEPSEYELNVVQRQAKVAQAEQQLARAKAEANASQVELKSLGRTKASDLALGLPQLRQASALLDSAKAELKLAKLNLARTKIYSPFTGRVEKENININQYINRNTNLATVFSTETMEVRLSMTAKQFAQIELPIGYYQSFENSKFPVRLYSEMAGKEVSWYGKIVRTEAVMDNRTRTIYAVAQVQDAYLNQATPLLSGLFVYAQIKGRAVENTTKLPQQALRNNSELWLVDKQKKLRIIKADIVQRTPDFIIVKNLEPNTLVITSALAIPTEGLNVVPIIQPSPNEIDSSTSKLSQHQQSHNKSAKKSESLTEEEINNAS